MNWPFRSSVFSTVGLPPYTRQPWLLVPRQTSGSIIMGQFNKSCVQQEVAPCIKIMICAIPTPIPAFLVVASRIGAEQYTSWFQRRAKLSQYSRQFQAGHMKQRCIGEHPVKLAFGQVKRKEILLPHLKALFASHLSKSWRSF